MKLQMFINTHNVTSAKYYIHFKVIIIIIIIIIPIINSSSNRI